MKYLCRVGVCLGLLVLLNLLLTLSSPALRAQGPPPGIPPHPTPRQNPDSIGFPIPRTGDQKLLILLVDFTDRTGLFTGQEWRSVFIGANGFEGYFKQVSYNQLRYSGDVVGIQQNTPVVNGNTVAYIRMPHPITFYADGMYGYKVNNFPKNHSGVVNDALEALDDAGFDLAPYANPTTKRVENVIVIFAGSTFAYTSDPNNSLEATAYRLTWGKGSLFTSDAGYTVDNYTFCPDQLANQSGQIAHVGVCAHEHGHALGESDLYDYSYTTAGAGRYDLMAYGTFGAADGLRPFHFGAFSKEFFGWITPTVAAPGTTTVQLGPAETGANFIKLYPNGNSNSKEYFLLENRRALGFDQDWESAGLCQGLIIWHVDQDIVANYPYGVNSLPGSGGGPHPGVIVVEADGGFDMIQDMNYGDCSDTWTVGRRWDTNSTPASRLWDGSSSGLALEVVGESGGNLTLQITTPNTCAVKPAKPALKSPADNATLAKSRPTLKWSASVCADTYTLIVKNVATNHIAYKKAGVTALRYKPDALPTNNTYKWFVKACNSYACAKSAPRRMTISQ